MALRPYRRGARIRYLLPLLVAVWALLPWRIAQDSEHFAPAFVVLLFRSLFEPDGEPASVAAGLLMATAIVPGALFRRSRHHLRVEEKGVDRPVLTGAKRRETGPPDVLGGVLWGRVRRFACRWRSEIAAARMPTVFWSRTLNDLREHRYVHRNGRTLNGRDRGRGTPTPRF